MSYASGARSRADWVRSARLVAFLGSQDFTRVRNLRGGIDAWAREVDPTVPRY